MRQFPLNPGFQPIDFDGIDEEELGRLEGFFEALSMYCKTMKLARMARKQGKIERAKRYEGFADNVYQDLPAWAKW